MRTFEVARMTTGGCSETEVEHVPCDQDTENNLNTGTNGNSPESQLDEQMEENPRKRLRSFDPTNLSSDNIKMKIAQVNGSTGRSCINGDEHFANSNAKIGQKRKRIDTILDELQAENDERLRKVLKHHEAKWVTEIEHLKERIAHLEKEKSELQKILMESCTSVNTAANCIEEIKTDLTKTSTNIQNHISNLGQI